MSFSKKIKRQQNLRIKKTAKITATIEEAEKRGWQLTEINKERVNMFCECKVIPAAAYIMVTQFGWTFANLRRMSERFEYFREMFIDGHRLGKTYITVEWLWEGMENECNFKYAVHKRLPLPKNQTASKNWLATYVKDYSISCLESLETVWLWILHEIFGFSGKRMRRFHEALVKFNPLEAPIKMIYHAMDRCEMLKSAKRNKDGEYETASFAVYRKELERLDVSGDGFANGLVIVTQRMRRKGEQHAG